VNKKQIFILIIVIVVGILGLTAVLYFQPGKVNYLILGVPYFGYYNFYFQGANSSAVASTMDILGYWGDGRFNVGDVSKKFIQASSTPFIVTIKKFFEDNGYETSRWDLNSQNKKSNDVLSEIKKYVNSEKKIPVIIYQEHSPESESAIIGPKVVIGVFDNTKKIVVNDNLLGNNYDISYQDFGNMFIRPAVLAVWPSDKIKSNLSGPKDQNPYPARTEAMNKVGSLLTIYEADSGAFLGDKKFEKQNQSLKRMINDPNFEYFPPVFKILFLSTFARSYVYLNQFKEAIDVINNQVLPLDKNLASPIQGWTVSPVDEVSYPYFVLSLAYLQSGQRDLAVDSYKKMISIRSSFEGKVSNYFSPKIPELEKEISAEK